MLNSNWKEVKLGDLLNFRRGHDLPKTSLNEGMIPVVGSNGIIGYHDTYTTKAPCVTVGRSGNIGKPNYINENCWAHNTTLYIDNFKGNNPLYLYYLLQTLQLSFYGGGSAVPTLNRNHIHPIKVKVTLDYNEQAKIADFLKEFDDKIEVIKRINENLLEQMNALYREFSTRSNWDAVTINEIAEKVAMGPFGSNIKVATFVDEGVPVISGNHLRGYFLEEPSYNYITEEHAERLKNSVVYPKDIIFTHAGNIGQVAMIPDDCNYPKYVLSQRQFYLRCNTTKVLPEYVTLFFHSIVGQHELLSYANQTGVPSIAQPATNLKKIKLPLPPINEQLQWNKNISAMINLYETNTHEITRLSQLRDALLPKLMSGEIDVSTVTI
jgi:type I restriction enzyme S subunit